MLSNAIQKPWGVTGLRLTWPWQDRSQRFSWLKACTFALMFAPAVWIIYDLGAGEFGPAPLGGMTYWSGLWATALLLLALAITPAAVIVRSGRPILVRRMIGVTALVYTIAHIIIYFALRFWDFRHIAHEMVTRLSLIVATLASVALIALGVTSLDTAVERMGPHGWNRLHSIVYVTTGLALVHYLLSPGSFPDQFLLSGMFFWLMLWRVLNRHRRGADPVALAVLAIASCIFTALLEALWNWLYHGDEPLWVLGNNFSLVLGISSAWKVLGLGLLIALTPAVRKALRPRAAGAGTR
jgi:methionine sulfoxide reductase heme-binding subunit